MAYVPVPKDLTHVRQKVLFNLTRRQLVCFLGGALVGAPLFYLLKPYVASSAASLIMVLVMIPFILLGVYEKNGEPLEVVLKHFFTATFLRPKKRPYQSENLYDALERQSALQKDVAQIEKKKKRKKLSREEKKLIRTKIKEADRRQETPYRAENHPLSAHVPGRHLPRHGYALYADDSVSGYQLPALSKRGQAGAL